MNRLRILVAGALALAACSPTPTVSPVATPVGTVESSGASLAPTTAPTVAAVELPNPGGTCDASTFKPASVPLASFTFAALNTRHLVIQAVFRHSGPTCTLGYPATIALGPSSEALVARKVANLGNNACIDNDCHTEYPADYAVYRYALVKITFNTWWWDDPNESELPSPRPCAEPLADVSRAEVPLDVGRLAFSWDTAIKTVCASPDTMSMGIEVVGDTDNVTSDPSSIVDAPPCREGRSR